jgi:hypothetical protein
MAMRRGILDDDIPAFEEPMGEGMMMFGNEEAPPLEYYDEYPEQGMAPLGEEDIGGANLLLEGQDEVGAAKVRGKRQGATGEWHDESMVADMAVGDDGENLEEGNGKRRKPLKLKRGLKVNNITSPFYHTWSHYRITTTLIVIYTRAETPLNMIHLHDIGYSKYAIYWNRVSRHSLIPSIFILSLFSIAAGCSRGFEQQAHQRGAYTYACICECNNYN